MISTTQRGLDRGSALSVSLVERCQDWVRSFQTQRQQGSTQDARKNLQRWSERNTQSWLPAGIKQWNRWRAQNPDLTIDLRGIDLRDVNLSGANLSRTILSGARLDGALLAGANLCGADLRNASLNRADLQGALIADANLSGATLWWTNLQGAVVSPDSLEVAHLQGLPRTFSD